MATPPPPRPSLSLRCKYGSVAIMVRENIKYWPLDLGISPKHNTYKSIFIQVQQKRGPDLVIGVIYQPPVQSLSDFNDEISILVSVLSKSKRNLILVGDFSKQDC